jgi:chromosome segregation ATPase
LQTHQHIEALTQALEEAQADASRWQERFVNQEAHVQRLDQQLAESRTNADAHVAELTRQLADMHAHAGRLGSLLEAASLHVSSFEGLLRGSEAATEDAKRETESLKAAAAGLSSRLEAVELESEAAREELTALRESEARRQARFVSRAADYLVTMGLRRAILRSFQPWLWLGRRAR